MFPSFSHELSYPHTTATELCNMVVLKEGVAAPELFAIYLYTPIGETGISLHPYWWEGKVELEGGGGWIVSSLCSIGDGGDGRGGIFTPLLGAVFVSVDKSSDFSWVFASCIFNWQCCRSDWPGICFQPLCVSNRVDSFFFVSILFNLHGIRCCRSDWPGLCVVINYQSDFERFFFV